MSEHNKAIVRRLFAELWNHGNLSVARFSLPTTRTMILRRPILAWAPTVKRGDWLSIAAPSPTFT